MNFIPRMTYLSPMQNVTRERGADLVDVQNAEAFQVEDHIHATDLSAMLCYGYVYEQEYASDNVGQRQFFYVPLSCKYTENIFQMLKAFHNINTIVHVGYVLYVCDAIVLINCRISSGVAEVLRVVKKSTEKKKVTSSEQILCSMQICG